VEIEKVRRMKEWQQNLVGSIVVAFIGIFLILAPYSFNLGYDFTLYQVMLFLVFGIFLLGVGFGLLIDTYTIYKLEKSIS